MKRRGDVGLAVVISFNASVGSGWKGAVFRRGRSLMVLGVCELRKSLREFIKGESELKPGCSVQSKE